MLCFYYRTSDGLIFALPALVGGLVLPVDTVRLGPVFILVDEAIWLLW